MFVGTDETVARIFNLSTLLLVMFATNYGGLSACVPARLKRSVLHIEEVNSTDT